MLTCSGALVHVSTAAQEPGTPAREHQSTAAQFQGRGRAQSPPPSGTGLIAGQVVDLGGAYRIYGLPPGDYLITALPMRQDAARVLTDDDVDSVLRGGVATGPLTADTVTLRSVGRIDAEINAEGRVTAVPNPKVVTDTQGRFAFADLRVGTYMLMATNRNGFTQGSAFVELGANQQITDVTVRLNRFGSIAGTIRDEAGDPIVKMKVDAFLKKTVGFKPILFPRGGGVTDDRGQFRIGDLPPGDYLLCACGREALSIDKTLLPLLGATPPSAAAVTQRMDASIPPSHRRSIPAARVRRKPSQSPWAPPMNAPGLTSRGAPSRQGGYRDNSPVWGSRRLLD